MGAAEKVEVRKITYDYILTKLDDLPTLPTIVGEINNLINDPLSSSKDIINVMQNDQSLTTKVLKLVNSAYYAIPGGVKTLERAIAMLGFDVLRQLVISTAVFNSLKTKDVDGFDVRKFWKHSIGVAVTAEAVGRAVQHKQSSELFTAGLVHDMGKLALLKVAPEIPTQVARYARDKKISFSEAEDQLDTVKHAMVGNMLATKWKLPQNLLNAIRYHHHVNIDMRKALTLEANQFLDVIIFANMFVHYIDFGDSGHNVRLRSPDDLNARLNINAENAKEISMKIKDALASAEGFIALISEEA